MKTARVAINGFGRIGRSVLRIAKTRKHFDIVAINRGLARLRHGTREYELTVPWYDHIRAAEASDGS